MPTLQEATVTEPVLCNLHFHSLHEEQHPSYQASKAATAEPQSSGEVGRQPQGQGADTVTRTLPTKIPLTVSKAPRVLHELQLLTGGARGLR